MEFGFGAILERIEEHFGKRAVRLLVALIGVATALFCAKIIWGIFMGFVSPPLALMGEMGVGKWLISVAVTGAAWLAGMVTAASITTSFLRWKHVKEARGIIDQGKSMLAEEKAQFDTRTAAVNDMMARATETAKRADELHERAEVRLAELEELRTALEKLPLQKAREVRTNPAGPARP